MTILFAALAAVLCVVCGAFLNRFRGGWLPGTMPDKGGRFIRLAVYTAPYGIAAATFAPIWAAGLVWVLTGVMASESHGPQMDLNRSPEEGERTNRADAIFGSTGYWSEFMGLGATGVIIHLPLGAAAAVFLHPVVGVAYIAAGFLKAPSYEIGHRFVGKLPLGLAGGPDSYGRNPDAGEAVWGAVTIGSAAALVLA